MSKPLKRKRETNQSGSEKKHRGASRNARTLQRASAVRSDSLAWKQVELPDRLEDAGGFYGLEEIEDVEVVKGADGKGVFFRPPLDSVVERTVIEDDHSDEWEGFFDDSANHTAAVENLDNRSTREPKKQSKEQPLTGDKSFSKSSEKSLSAGERSFESSAGFSVLEDGTQDDECDVEEWKELGLSPTLLSAVAALEFSRPTPIQRSAIPPVLSGNDVIGKAVTGSGKTLAFGIPIVEKWLEGTQTFQSVSHSPIALVLAPTRELAHQLTKHLSALCKTLEEAPRIVPVTGGLSVLKQQRQLENADIIVATPGRLWEVINDSHGLIEKLKKTQFLVVDEADRLLSEGHFKEVEEIIDALEREIVNETHTDDLNTENESKKVSRQTLVFSATFHQGLQQKLAVKQKFKASMNGDLLSTKQSMDYLLHKLSFQQDSKPIFIDANPASQMAENLSETILECGAMQKDLYLYAYLLQNQHDRRKTSDGQSASRILVFTNSVASVKRLIPLLQNLNLPSTTILPLHSNMAQKARLRSLERFSGIDSTAPAKDDRTNVLIATDVAARGLDIKGISNIVHYHVPRTADTYVHRSGRTARADEKGSSILLCSPDEIAGVTRLIAKIHTDGSANNIKDVGKIIDRMYIPHDLIRQIDNRVDLAQKITNATQATEKVKSEDNWLRNAAEDLGVDYDSEEFEEAGKKSRRGRGGGRERKQKKEAADEDKSFKLAQWKAKLREELKRRIDFGNDSGLRAKYLAGGAVDVDKLLAERS